MTGPAMAGDALALPMEAGLYYRLHHMSAPFGPEHASSTVIGDAEGRSTRRGYSALSNPWELERYMDEMEWLGHSAIDLAGRRVIAFRGCEAGTGSNGEPLVMPRPGAPEMTMAWDEFTRRLEHTPEYHLDRLPPELRWQQAR